MLQLLNVFQKQGYAITVASAASKSEFSLDLTALAIDMRDIQMNDSSFDVFVKELDPSVVLFDRFLTEEQFGWRVVEQVPDALRILDTEDLHSLRHVRDHCFKKGVNFTTDIWLQDTKTKREIASIYRCDLSLIISSYELELLTEVLKIDKSLLLLLPFMVTEINENIQWPTYEQRTDFLFIGGGKHAPNIDAILHLKTNIWQFIRQQLPDAKLHVYGAYLPQQVLEMHNIKEGFLVRGRTEDVQMVMQQARVCLAPLRFGAGIKGKLLEAMRNGTPSVTTSIGAEGMQGILEWNGFVENAAEDFANAAVRLYTEGSAWQIAQEQGKTLVNTLFSKNSLETLLVSKLDALQMNLSHHRKQNFIGALLQHQTLSATKYMGKWIEEKNRGV
ncbi:glycosyltransferase [Maribacter sp. X9]|uniref:glycosyltransferase n=1 Tax=Maribacter sp. X9 TaxID=3402159 RepID=UPI003AF3C514